MAQETELYYLFIHFYFNIIDWEIIVMYIFLFLIFFHSSFSFFFWHLCAVFAFLSFFLLPLSFSLFLEMVLSSFVNLWHHFSRDLCHWITDCDVATFRWFFFSLYPPLSLLGWPCLRSSASLQAHRLWKCISGLNSLVTAPIVTRSTQAAASAHCIMLPYAVIIAVLPIPIKVHKAWGSVTKERFGDWTYSLMCVCVNSGPFFLPLCMWCKF